MNASTLLLLIIDIVVLVIDLISFYRNVEKYRQITHPRRQVYLIFSVLLGSAMVILLISMALIISSDK